MIKEKAEYCLNCKNKPCSLKGCPLGNDIPLFINAIKQEQYEEAYKILSQTTVLPAICGRICPHFKQCMGSCVRGIKNAPVSIGELEAFIGDMSINKKWEINCSNKENKNLKKYNIAIIGGGPAGLTSASFLAMKGHKVTIFEKNNYLGGLLIHGVPEFRLNKKIVENSIEKILNLGIDVKYNQELGKNLDINILEKEYDKIILAFGANISSKMNIPGENLCGVYGGNELLEYNSHPNYNGKTVIICGGGNVAIDTARTVKRLGAEKVIVVYRRAKEQMPAENKEAEDAIEEGIEFLFQNNIVKIIGEENRKTNNTDIYSKNNEAKKVVAVELIKTELVKKEGEDRLIPINIKNSNYIVKTDYVIMAIGSYPSEIVKNLGLELDKYGFIKTTEYGQTSNPRIYAVGDLAGNKATVAWAARSGRNCAFGIENN